MTTLVKASVKGQGEACSSGFFDIVNGIAYKLRLAESSAAGLCFGGCVSNNECPQRNVREAR
jgi:hypothetical protein